MPPAQVLQVVVLPAELEAVVGCHHVVHPPQPGGHPVGQEDIYAVVAPGQEEEDDPEHARQEGSPVKEKIFGRGV